ncbi:MAG: polymerase sigma-70 factor [Rhodoglobus sp.]|nr:polymerase sigma-70 factor [Rhodoglobus sp.]
MGDAAEALALPTAPETGMRHRATTAGMGSEAFDAVLAAAQAGSGWAFRTIWQEYAPAVAAFARARGSREADDLTSDVFLALFEQLPDFVGGEPELRSFVFSIAYRRLVDELRRRTRRGEARPWSAEEDVRESPSAEDAALERLGEASAVQLLDDLPEDQRNVMVLRILGDLTIEQIAEVVGKRAGAVKALQHRALQSLRKKVSPGRTLSD